MMKQDDENSLPGEKLIQGFEQEQTSNFTIFTADSILMGNFGSESTLYPSLPVPSAPPLPAKSNQRLHSYRIDNAEELQTVFVQSGNDVSWDASTYQGFQADLPRPKARTFSVSSAASVVSEKRKRNGLVI